MFLSEALGIFGTVKAGALEEPVSAASVGLSCYNKPLLKEGVIVFPFY